MTRRAIVTAPAAAAAPQSPRARRGRSRRRARRPPPGAARGAGGAQLPDALALPADVTDPAAARAAVDGAAARWAGLDVLVDNAGVADSGRRRARLLTRFASARRRNRTPVLPKLVSSGLRAAFGALATMAAARAAAAAWRVATGEEPPERG